MIVDRIIIMTIEIPATSVGLRGKKQVSFLADLQPGGQGRRLVCSSHTTSRESINPSIYDGWYEAFFQSPKADKERSPSASGEYYLITFDCRVLLPARYKFCKGKTFFNE